MGIGFLPAGGIINRRALRDTKQDIMRGGGFAVPEIAVIGGDQRQVHFIGQIDQPGFSLTFPRHAMTLDFNIDTAIKERHQGFQPAPGQRVLPFSHRGRDIPGPGAAGEEDQAIRSPLKRSERDHRRVTAIKESIRDQAGKVLPAGFILDQEGYLTAFFITAVTQRDLRPDDRLDTHISRLFRKFEGGKGVETVGDRNRGLAMIAHSLNQRADLEHAFGQRIGRMGAEMNKERGIGHGLY